MGFDLTCLGGGMSYNIAAWKFLFDVGLAFGWNPEGAIPASTLDCAGAQGPQDRRGPLHRLLPGTSRFDALVEHRRWSLRSTSLLLLRGLPLARYLRRP
jgi:hypothetical protein